MKEMSRKKKLLQRHRLKKRLLILLCLLALIGLGFYAGFLWILPCLVFLWVAHEVRFSDHIFYSPADDYRYPFDKSLEVIPVSLVAGRLTLADANTYPLQDDDTLLLEITPRASILGYWFDPALIIRAENTSDREGLMDCQTFERGVRGLRYLNLTGFGKTLRENGLHLEGRYCRLTGTTRLLRARHPDYRQQRLLVIAPHADDAELAAFGLYSQARESWIVTLTAGEIEAEHYQQMGLSNVQAARMKGRLRAWDSITVPIWGNVPPERTFQLGYFCLKLAAMQREPEKAIASEVAELCDTRPFRVFNRCKLTSDANGLPTWRNLVADLGEIIAHVKPEVVVLPHPLLDPHPDHVAAHAAIVQVLQGMDLSPPLLCYANHLHDTDRWPMGEAHCGVALPPLFENNGTLVPYVLPLEKTHQIDKAMALGMMHDLAVPLSFKERCRRTLQHFLAGRKHPSYGENEFFRKAVRRHELFFLDQAKGEEES